MKRPLQPAAVVGLGTALVACTYGLVRYAYGLSVPVAQRDLGLSTTAVGLVSAATSVAYCLAAVLAFWWCERRPRLVVAAAGAVASVGAAGAGLAGGAGTFAVAVVVGSAGAGAASPGLVVLVRQAVRTAGEDRAQATVNSGTGPGLVAAGVLALATGRDWQAGWVAAGLATALVTVALLRAAPHPAGSGGAPRTRPDVSPAWLRPATAALLLGVGSAAVWTYGRGVLEDGGLTGPGAVGAWICLGLGAAAAAVVAPRLLRHGPGAAWPTCAVLTGAATAVLALPPLGPLPWLAAAGFGLGFTTATTVLIAWATRVSRTPGPAVAAFFVCLLLGQAVGAPLAGALLAGGAATAFAVAGVATAATAALARSVPAATPGLTSSGA